jgi:tRNA (guanine9-N1)-methyltransferase
VEQEARVAHAFAHAPRVAIDLSFASTLSAVEQKSLWRQLQVCYGANRRAAAPLSLHLTSLAGCPSEGIDLGWLPDRPPTSSAVERVRALGWTVGVHEGAVTEHFDPASVVYLSPDADTVLDKLQGDTVYVLGGLVDRSVRRGASLSRAARLGVRTARLPLQARSCLCPHLRPCPPQYPRQRPLPRPPLTRTFTSPSP